MKFFEVTLVMRNTLPNQLYQQHQRLDTLIQEGCDHRFRYSYLTIPHPSQPSSSIALIRTRTALGLPNTHAKELNVEEGQTVLFRTYMTYRAPGRAARVSAAPDEIEGRIPFALRARGMELVTAKIIRHDKVTIEKGKKSRNQKHGFFVHAYEITIIAKVIDRGLFEQAVVEGVGCTRVFGFGMMRDIEVLL